MSFKTEPGQPLRGLATYLPDEYSIVFVRDEEDPHGLGLGREFLDGALEFGTLTLTVRGDDGRVAFPEGYHPAVAWHEGPLVVPAAMPGVLYWEPVEDLVKGGALGIAKVSEVATTSDPSTGWIVLRRAAEDTTPHAGLAAVEFCEGVIAELDGSRLVSLWMLLRSASRN